MWLTGEKLHGTFYEHPTQRSFLADCHYNLNLDYLHESLRGKLFIYSLISLFTLLVIVMFLLWFTFLLMLRIYSKESVHI
jgi:hypothetical protein